MGKTSIALILTVNILILATMQPARSQASNSYTSATSNIQTQQQQSDKQKEEEFNRLWLKWIGSMIIPALIPLGLFLWLRMAMKK